MSDKTLPKTAKCILVVDDEVDFANALKSALARAGFRVITCNETSSAAQALVNQKFACVVFDYHLGGVSGETLVTQIKKNPNHLNATTPFIFMSGDPDKDAIQRMAKNIRGALIKPFAAKELIEKINVLLKLAPQSVN